MTSECLKDPAGHHKQFIVTINPNEDSSSSVKLVLISSSPIGSTISKFDCRKERIIDDTFYGMISKRAGMGITQGASERPLGLKLSPPETPWSNLPGGDLVVWSASFAPLSLHTLPVKNLRKLCDRLLLDASQAENSNEEFFMIRKPWYDST